MYYFPYWHNCCDNDFQAYFIQNLITLLKMLIFTRYFQLNWAHYMGKVSLAFYLLSHGLIMCFIAVYSSILARKETFCPCLSFCCSPGLRNSTSFFSISYHLVDMCKKNDASLRLFSKLM
jgi:hypothetical protein